MRKLLVTVETFKYGVTCVACHTPHDTPGDDKPAVADVAALCKDCHNATWKKGQPSSSLAPPPGTLSRR
jgi:predicted CXXCH cytochrome family protein